MSKLNNDIIMRGVEQILAFSAGEDIQYDGKTKVG
eukprot:CAMPEP_0184094996 /NCGR_PEP_ID=MMETSP0974-20121125/9542_1 /TAXON_ID=483370 /ORGANISM="non described non described, Strain CCMP2097" /LENGTH=34 /DNA_ID= /DNA_START= /DNA_END= /DNA_ORIENTATION=